MTVQPVGPAPTPGPAPAPVTPPAPDPTTTPPTPPVPTGPAGGQDALKADLARERDKRQALETEVEKLKPLAKLAELLNPGDPGKASTEIEQITARLDAQDKAVAAANIRAVGAEVKAAASNWADPADAVLHLGDLSDYMGKDGTADTAKISAKLAEVLAAKPYLAKDSAPGKGGVRSDPGQGARGGNTPSGKDAGLAEARKRFGTPANTK